MKTPVWTKDCLSVKQISNSNEVQLQFAISINQPQPVMNDNQQHYNSTGQQPQYTMSSNRPNHPMNGQTPSVMNGHQQSSFTPMMDKNQGSLPLDPRLSIPMLSGPGLMASVLSGSIPSGNMMSHPMFGSSAPTSSSGPLSSNLPSFVSMASNDLRRGYVDPNIVMRYAQYPSYLGQNISYGSPHSFPMGVGTNPSSQQMLNSNALFASDNNNTNSQQQQSREMDIIANNSVTETQDSNEVENRKC